MAFIGFEFNKINVDKKDGVSGKITVNHNVTITDVSKADLKIANHAENAIKFTFEYTSKYGDLGGILLGGKVMYLSNPDEITSLLEDWKNDKKVKKELMAPLLNKILSKSNIQAIILSDSVGLPPPVELPRVKPTE